MHGCCVELDELLKLYLGVIWMCLSMFGSAEGGWPIDAKFILIKIEKTCYDPNLRWEMNHDQII